MKSDQTLKIIRHIEDYNGNGNNGPYTIGTFLLGSVSDDSKVVCKAFTDDTNKLKSNIGQVMDCTLVINCREYNGKFYNDIMVNNLQFKNNVVDASVEDIMKVPEVVDQTNQLGGSSFNLPGAEDDLPF